jgi:hypothetical protein
MLSLFSLLLVLLVEAERVSVLESGGLGGMCKLSFFVRRHHSYW